MKKLIMGGGCWSMVVGDDGGGSDRNSTPLRIPGSGDHNSTPLNLKPCCWHGDIAGGGDGGWVKSGPDLVLIWS